METKSRERISIDLQGLKRVFWRAIESLGCVTLSVDAKDLGASVGCAS